MLINQKCLNCTCLNGVIDTEVKISLIAVYVDDILLAGESTMVPDPKLYYDTGNGVTELTPNKLITHVVQFVDSFPNLTGLRVTLEIRLTLLQCQFIQALLETLYASSIYNKIKTFEMIDYISRLNLETVYLLVDSYIEVLTEGVILRRKELEMLIPIRRYSRIKGIPQCHNAFTRLSRKLKLCTTL